MKKHHSLTLIVLLALLAAGAADNANATLEILPSWEYIPGVLEQGVRMGSDVAGVGSVNGDLYADILVGSEKRGVNREGWVGLFYGSATGPHNLPDWQVYGEKKGSEFGSAVAGVGFINDDIYSDIIVGAPSYNGDQAAEGAAYVYYGSAAGPSLTWDWRIEGDLPNVSLGKAVAGGYINGDDYADVIIGMPGYDSDLWDNVGQAFVYFGSPTGLTDVGSWWDRGEQQAGQFGLEVAYAGDVNGDGFGDVLIGEPFYNRDEFQDVGAVYLYLGTLSSMINVHAWAFQGEHGADRLGTSAAGIGDVNGDDCDDIAIGAPYYNHEGFSDAGRVYVFYGCQETLSGLNDLPDWAYSPSQAYAFFGIDVNGGGDTDHDTFNELLVGAHMYDGLTVDEGAVFAFFGGLGGLPDYPGWQAEGNKNDTEFGFRVDGAGDTDRDGFADVIVGSPMYRTNENLKGAAFLYFGTSDKTFYFVHLPFLIKQ